jgi:hypothetical protein
MDMHIPVPKALATKLHQRNVPPEMIEQHVVAALWECVAEQAARSAARRRKDKVTQYFKQIILEMNGGSAPSADEPFMGELTRAEYLALPEAARAALWDKWHREAESRIEAKGFKPHRVRADAIPAR